MKHMFIKILEKKESSDDDNVAPLLDLAGNQRFGGRLTGLHTICGRNQQKSWFTRSLF